MFDLITAIQNNPTLWILIGAALLTSMLFFLIYMITKNYNNATIGFMMLIILIFLVFYLMVSLNPVKPVGILLQPNF